MRGAAAGWRGIRRLVVLVASSAEAVASHMDSLVRRSSRPGWRVCHCVACSGGAFLGLGVPRSRGRECRRRCGVCGKVLRPYDSISVAEVGERCCRCFNEELAERLGVNFDNTPIAPVAVTDVDGVGHRFEIRSMLVGTGHAMSAREIGHRDARGGYRFQILGDLEADAQDLFKLLRERIRQGLNVRPRDRRCAPASHRRWPTVHLGPDRPPDDDVRGLHAERGRGGHHRDRRRPARRWSSREPGLEAFDHKGSVDSGVARDCA